MYDMFHLKSLNAMNEHVCSLHYLFIYAHAYIAHNCYLSIGK